MRVKTLDADQLILRHSDGTVYKVVTTKNVDQAANKITVSIPVSAWQDNDGMYTYAYNNMNITSANTVLVNPAIDKTNLKEIATCMVVSEQERSTINFYAALKKPTRTVEFKLTVL